MYMTVYYTLRNLASILSSTPDVIPSLHMCQFLTLDGRAGLPPLIEPQYSFGKTILSQENAETR